MTYGFFNPLDFSDKSGWKYNQLQRLFDTWYLKKMVSENSWDLKSIKSLKFVAPLHPKRCCIYKTGDQIFTDFDRHSL